MQGTAPGSRGNRSRTSIGAVTAALAGGLVIGVLPADLASAREDLPSRAEVRAAQQRTADKARDVGEVKAALLLANRRLEDAAIAAQQAAEAYNGALWRLDEARRALRAARDEAAAARDDARRQREQIGAMVASSYQRAGELTAMSAVAGADGPEGVLDRLAGFQGVASTMQSRYDRYAAAETVAQTFARRARQARAEADRLADEAQAARDRAAAAAEAAQASADAITAEKDRLIRELARAQGISVSLARQRQTALEERARQRAAARAQQAAEAEALQEAAERAEAERLAARAQLQDRADESDRAVQPAESTSQVRAPRRQPRQQSGSRIAPEPTPQPAPRPRPAPQPRPEPEPESEPEPRPEPEPAPAPAPAPAPSRSGADRAIAFAKQQLGEPYVWGADGPSSWDCSGLTMRAWERGGKYLPHYSVAQYQQSTPIGVSELRRGDLVFWSSSSSPSSIFHVAMYIGNGRIIHAPRTGRPVTVESLYYWRPPNFYGRV